MRDSLESVGGLYRQLGTMTVQLQPLPSFMDRWLPEVNKMIYTKDHALISYILTNGDRHPRRAGYLNENVQAIQRDLGQLVSQIVTPSFLAHIF